MHSSHYSRSLLCIALLIVSISCVHATITASEETALAQILAAFPALSNAQQDPSLYTIMNGASNSWPSNLASVCSGADGYDIHGIHCTHGHVDGILFSDAWGPIDGSKSLANLHGLSYLTSFTCVGLQSRMNSSFVQFATALLGQVALESMELAGTNLDTPPLYTLIQAENSLKTLRLAFAVSEIPNFSGLTQLQSLTLNMNNKLVDLSPLLPLASSLQNLVLDGNSLLRIISNLANMTALQTANLAMMSGYVGSFPATLTLPVNLVSLSVSDAPRSPVGIIATGTKFTTLTWANFLSSIELTAVPSTVTTLTIQASYGGMLNGLNFVFPPALQTLTINPGTMGGSIHSSIASCSQLSSFTLSNTNLTYFVNAIPSLRNTAITRLSIESTAANTPVSAVDKFVCNIVDPSKLQSLTLGNEIKSIPSCGSAAPYPALQSLIASGSLNYANSSQFQTDALGLLPSSLAEISIFSSNVGVADGLFDWDAFVTRFSALQRLRFLASSFAGTFPTQIVRLSALNYLDFTNNHLTGTVPEGLFSNLTQLTTLLVPNNQLNGTFPWYGLETVQSIYAHGNQFSSWPSIAGGAPNLATIDFSNNVLSQIPDDISFSQMTSLSTFILNNNPTLGGPVPRFWANHPAISDFAASNCALTGTLPASLTSRQLVYVGLGANVICGSLFDVPQPRGLVELHLENNLLTGTIPSSWARSLTVQSVFAIFSNYLNGTIPSPFLSTLSATLAQFQASNNNFYGPVPDFFDFRSLSSVSLGHSSLDLCAHTPNITVASLTCSLSNVAVDACNCASKWAVCTGFTCSSTPPPAATIDPTPADYVCRIPADRPAAPGVRASIALVSAGGAADRCSELESNDRERPSSLKLA